MKAVFCTRYGSPEVLEIKETEKPVPKDSEIRIKIHTTAVTSGDCRTRSFNVPASFWIPGRLMLGITKPKKAILGRLFAGDVDAVGKDVTRFKAGDRVFGFSGHHFGSYAEYVCLPETGILTTIPDKMTYKAAVAIVFGGITALHFLRKASVQNGQKVLIYGASGSVGTYAIQLAKIFGAEVTGVCSTSKIELAEELGADKIIDYTKENFAENGEIYDVIFDAVGKSSFADSMKLLKETGVYLQAVAAPAMNTRMKLTEMTSSKILVGGTAVPTVEGLDYLKELVVEGKLKPVIDRCYPMAEIVEAHRYVDEGHKKGSVVIMMTNGQAT